MVDNLSDYMRKGLVELGDALQISVLSGCDVNVIDTLVHKLGFDVNSYCSGNIESFRAIHYAVYGDNAAAVKRLLELGADVHDTSVRPDQLEEEDEVMIYGREGLTVYRYPLNISISCVCTSVFDYFCDTLDKDTLTKGYGSGSNTIHRVAGRGTADMMRKLLSCTHDTFEDYTCEVVPYVNVVEDDGPPLMAATRFNMENGLEVVRVLIEAGADVNQICGDQRHTSLKWAVIRKRPDVCRELVKAGADPLVIDSEGKIAIQYAEDIDAYAEIMKALI